MAKIFDLEPLNSFIKIFPEEHKIFAFVLTLVFFILPTILKNKGLPNWFGPSAYIIALICLLVGLAQVLKEKSVPSSSTVNQTTILSTTAPNSPVLYGVSGGVTLNYQNIDPYEMSNLIYEKIKSENKEQVDNLQRDKEVWEKRYLDLVNQLASNKATDVISSQVQQLMQSGQFDKAGEMIDKTLGTDEQNTAYHHFIRAQLFSLQFKPLEALLHYEKAYNYSPDDPKYGYGYATILLEQKRFGDAEPIYQKALDDYTRLARANPANYEPDISQLLENLGVLYVYTGRFEEAEKAFNRSLEIYRRLVSINPTNYEPRMSSVLNDLGNLYGNTQQFDKAEEMYEKSLKLRRDLSKTNLEGVAMTLMNMGNLFKNMRRFEEAKKRYINALEIYQNLSKTNPAFYEIYVGRTLNNLGNFYSDTHSLLEAEKVYEQSLEIYRRLAKANPAAYEPEIANIQNNLGVLYSDTKRFDKSEKVYEESLDIYRHLSKINLTAYESSVARVQSNLGFLYLQTKQFVQGEKRSREAIAIYRQYWKKNPNVYGNELGKSLMILTDILIQIKGQDTEGCTLAQEAKRVIYDEALKQEAQVKIEKFCK